MKQYGSNDRIHTRLCNANTDTTTLKSRARESKRFLEAFNRSKLDVAETFRATIQLVLNNADVGHFAIGKQLRDVAGGGIEGKVADMSGKGRLGRKREFGSRRECRALAV
jgi:hypothetical protein